MDQVLVFDLRGTYGHYRKNYSPVSPVTFPCPTPTAAIGTIAGMIGLEKREYLSRFADGSWKLGITLLNPVRKYRAGINLINTRLDPKTFRPKGKSPRIQIPFEFLKDAAFRFYFWHDNSNLFEAVKQQLETGTTVFTPSLGLAQCLGEVEYHGCKIIERVTESHESSFSSILPLTEGVEIEYETGKRYQRFTMPVVMHPGRVVKKYQNVIAEESGGSITARNVTGYKLGEKTIAFFESDE